MAPLMGKSLPLFIHGLLTPQSSNSARGPRLIGWGESRVQRSAPDTRSLNSESATPRRAWVERAPEIRTVC